MPVWALASRTTSRGRRVRARWAQALTDAGLPFSPVFLQHEWEQVILAQHLRTEQATHT